MNRRKRYLEEWKRKKRGSDLPIQLHNLISKPPKLGGAVREQRNKTIKGKLTKEGRREGASAWLEKESILPKDRTGRWAGLHGRYKKDSKQGVGKKGRGERVGPRVPVISHELGGVKAQEGKNTVAIERSLENWELSSGKAGESDTKKHIRN